MPIKHFTKMQREISQSGFKTLNACGISGIFRKKCKAPSVQSAGIRAPMQYQDFRVVGEVLLDANLHNELAGALPHRPPRLPPLQ
jgi:hypothetical protein